MYVCMYVCMYACMHACMYVCICMYAYMYLYTCIKFGGGFSETCLGPAFRVHGSLISRHGPSEGPQGQNRDTAQGISIGIPIIISRGVPLRGGDHPLGGRTFILYSSYEYIQTNTYMCT